MKIMDKIIFDAEISERKILIIPINTIIATPYNPPERTQDGQKLRKLSESIKKYGLIQPIIINCERELVDGNRRLKASMLAGKTHIECIILSAEIDQDDAFGTLNTNSDNMTKRGWLYACRHEMKNPPKEIWDQYQEIYRLVGTYGIDMMIEKKIGLSMLNFAKQIKAKGVVMRLDEIIMRVVQKKLTNRINMVMRDKTLPDQEIVRVITEILTA